MERGEAEMRNGELCWVGEDVLKRRDRGKSLERKVGLEATATSVAGRS